MSALSVLLNKTVEVDTDNGPELVKVSFNNPNVTHAYTRGEACKYREYIRAHNMKAKIIPLSIYPGEFVVLSW